MDLTVLACIAGINSQKRHPKGIKTVSECKKIMNTPSPFLLTLFPLRLIVCSSHFSLTHLYTYLSKVMTWR